MGHLRQHKHFLLQFVNFSCTNFVEKLPFSIMALNEKAAKDRKLEKDKCTSYRETNWPKFELWKLCTILFRKIAAAFDFILQ